MRIFFEGPNDTGAWMLQWGNSIFKFRFPGTTPDETYAGVEEFASEMVSGQSDAAGWAAANLQGVGRIAGNSPDFDGWRTLCTNHDSIEFSGDIRFSAEDVDADNLWDCIVDAGTALAEVVA